MAAAGPQADAIRRAIEQTERERQEKSALGKQPPSPVQRGSLPPPPLTGEAKPNAELPNPGLTREQIEEMGMGFGSPEQAATPAPQPAPNQMERAKIRAGFRGIPANTQVHYDNLAAQRGFDKDGSGGLSPDEWADLTPEDRGRLRRDAHDSQRVHTQGNWRDKVAAENSARLEGISFGHARSRLQSGRAATMIGEGNALLNSPDAADRIRGRAMIAQGEAMAGHASEALKFHEAEHGRMVENQRQMYWGNQMRGAMGHMQPIVAATAVRGIADMVGQGAANARADREMDQRERLAFGQQGLEREGLQSRERIAAREHDGRMAQIDAQLVIADRELEAARASRDEAKIAEAQHRKDQLEIQRGQLNISRENLALNQRAAGQKEAEAQKPEQDANAIQSLMADMPLDEHAPHFSQLETQFQDRLNRMELKPGQREMYLGQWNSFVKNQLSLRVMKGGRALREGDQNQLEQLIYQPTESGVVAMPRQDFVASVAQHYTGPNAEELRRRLALVYDRLTARYEAAKPKQASIGTSDALAFTA